MGNFIPNVYHTRTQALERLSNYSTGFRKLLQTRTYLTRDIKKQLSIYTVDKQNNDTTLIGSMSYKTSNASDVDNYEIIEKPSKKQVIDFFKVNLLRVSNDIYKLKKQYFLEVKMGLDHLYSDIDIGNCQNDVYNVSNDFFIKMQYYNKFGFINDTEYEIIKNTERKGIKQRHQIDFEIIQLLIRKRSVLRWSIDELNAGYKKLVNQLRQEYKYSIEDALVEKSPVNIEGVFIDDENYYKECSNFFDIRYEQNDKIMSLNLNEAMIYDSYNYRKDNLLQSVYSLIHSKLSPNIMKSCKRLFSYGKLTKNILLLEKVYPIINSQLGKTYLLMSKLKTCMKIATLNNGEKINKDAFYHSIDKVRFDLDELIFIHYDFSDITHILDMILVSDINDELVNMLDNVLKSLMNFINNQTQIKMELVGLYPLPKYLISTKTPF
jgi:hypothetical protein